MFFTHLLHPDSAFISWFSMLWLRLRRASPFSFGCFRDSIRSACAYGLLPCSLCAQSWRLLPPTQNSLSGRWSALPEWENYIHWI